LVFKFTSRSVRDLKEPNVFLLAPASASFDDIANGRYGRASHLRLQSETLGNWEPRSVTINRYRKSIRKRENLESSVISHEALPWF
jgi:hypothetical protein